MAFDTPTLRTSPRSTLTDMVREAKARAQMAQIWLTCDAEGVRFPLPWLPTEYTLTCGTAHGSFDIIGLGEITVLHDRPLMELSFSSRLPGRSRPGTSTHEVQPAETYKEAMIGMQRSKYPSHIIITGEGCNLNMFCTITNLTFTPKGGDVGTLYYDIALKEWRETSDRQVQVDPITKVAVVPLLEVTRTDTRKIPSTYEFKSGDSLRKVAKTILGDEERWRDIYDLNRDTVAHPMLVPLGTVLQLPL